jgi:phosphohistidine phosphatase
MLTLLILRHAKSGHEEGLPDQARTLTERGKKASRKMGKVAVEFGLVPDRIQCSTAVRARETVLGFLPAATGAGPVTYLDELYLAEPSAYVRALVEHGGDAERVMVVGHNPGLEDLLTDLTGERVELPTAALVECALEIRKWDELSFESRGTLKRFFRPKDLD